MVILSDETLRNKVLDNEIYIHPLPQDNQFQPSSIDLRLDYIFKTYIQNRIPVIDTHNHHLDLERDVETNILKYRHDPVRVQPNSFVLDQRIERIKMPYDLVGTVEGRSSFGRLGLAIHITAGYIDPGFDGKITLEIKNLNTIPIAIYPESRICQIVFHTMDKESKVPYGSGDLKSKYQFQEEPTVSRIGEDYGQY